MTIYDAGLQLEASTRTWSTGLQYATDTIALADLRDVGAGTTLYCEIQVTETFTTGNGATLVGAVIVADTTDLSGDPQIVAQLGSALTPMTAAMLVEGARFTLPLGSLDETRKAVPSALYLGFLTVTTNNWTGGALNIRIILNANDNPAWKAFPASFEQFVVS